MRELREPATGELLAPCGDGRRGRRRPRGRGGARSARRRVGQDAGDRALAPAARARRRDRRQPQGARRARVAQRRQGDLVGQGRARRRDRELPLLRVRDRVDRRPLEPDRRLAALLLAEGAGRRRGADRALELPAPDGDVEARARARRRLRRRAQAGSADAALACCASPSWRPRSASRPARSTSSPATGRRPARTSSRIPASTRSRSPARRRRAARSCGCAPTRSSALTLELGGKSPNLVFADADLGDAIPASVWAIYYSAGQSCEARSRLLVERSIYDDVVAQVTELAQKVKVGDPLDAETQMGSLISKAHREKVHGFVDGARERGRRGDDRRRERRRRRRVLSADRDREDRTTRFAPRRKRSSALS